MSQPDLLNLRVLAIIPAYNEAAGILDVVAGVQAYLPVLVVDDGSSDNTADLAEGAGASVLRQLPNQGKGAALAGFRWAPSMTVRQRLPWIQRPTRPGETPKFLDAFRQQNADLVSASAFSHDAAPPPPGDRAGQDQLFRGGRNAYPR
jgi:glycosyltransferase involved in cell wall biosynthesis